MIKEQGVVQERKKNRVLVRIRQSGACSHCQTKDSCEAGKKNIEVWLENTLNCAEGDIVELTLPDGVILQLSMLVYLAPVIAMLVGAFTGAGISGVIGMDESVAAALGGVIFLVISFGLLKLYERKDSVREKYLPRLLKKIKE